MAESDTSQRRLNAVIRGRRVLELRLAGLTYEQIGEQVGLSKAGVRKAILSAMKRTQQEPADELRELEGGRLDTAQRAIWSQVIKGDLPAIDRFVRISERRSKLFGIDAPTKVDLRVEEIDAAIERQLALLAGGGEAADVAAPPDDECDEEPE